MAIIEKDCPSCKGSSSNANCWRCDGFGWVEHDTTDKYYYWLIGIVIAYMLFQLARYFI